MTERVPCEVEGCTRNALRKKKLCARCLVSHDPVPEHHVAAERSCIRCGTSFPSSWAGERICTPCRAGEFRAEKEAVKRQQTPAHYSGPFEPIGVPGIAA